ncbi:MAG TPA: hypothetical protein DGR08_04445 [Synechococcales bacterium UBA12195]|nr:hypothetical protein [Synechococcales bacterium UBA12195]
MNEGALQWQHCHIVERYSSGITEQDAPAWVVQLLLHGEEQPLVDGAWLAELLLELLKPEQQPAIRAALENQALEPQLLSTSCVDLARLLLTPWPVRELEPLQAQEVMAQCPWHEPLGEALELCRSLIAAALFDGAQEERQALATALQTLRQRVLDVQNDRLATAVIQAARRRGIAVSLVSDLMTPYPLLQLGTGCRSRLLSYSASDGESALGANICGNKQLSHTLLQRLGIPVPHQALVPIDAGTELLRRVLAQVGDPCVVKPASQEQGRGVSLNIRGVEALRQAIARAGGYGDAAVLVEQQCPGTYYRLVVLNQQLAWLVQSEPPFVIGDGKLNITALLEQANQARLHKPKAPWLPTSSEAAAIHAAALADQGFTPTSIPKAGQKVVVTAINPEQRKDWVRQKLLPHEIDPSYSAMASAIAKTLAMSNLGIDVLSTDIRRPLQDPGSVVLELNHRQELGAVWSQRLIEELFPDQSPPHIPIKLVVLGHPSEWRSSWLEGGVSPHPTALSPMVAQWLESDHGAATAGTLRYRHPRELLSNRAIAGLTWVISWDEMVQQGLPCQGISRLLLPIEEPTDQAEQQLRQQLISQRGAIPRRF